MITKSCLSFTAIAATFIFLIYTVDDASALGRGGARDGGSEPYAVGGQHAGGSQAYGGQPYASGIKIARRGGGGGRGGGRGGAHASRAHHGGSAKRGGGGGYSRSGSAASGSFSHGSRHAQPTRSKRPTASAPKTASRSGAQQNRKQASKGGQRTRKQDQRDRKGDRQDNRPDRTEKREDAKAAREKARQNKAYYYAQQDNYYYGGGGYYGDDWDDGEVAAVALGSAALGYAAGQSSAQNTAPAPSSTVVYNASPSGSGGLPCNPNTTVVNNITYYQCGNDWYIQAYGESGVIYMPVPPPK